MYIVNDAGPLRVLAEHLLSLELPTATLKEYQKLVLLPKTDPRAETDTLVTLEIPGGAPPPKPSLSPAQKPLVVAIGATTAVELAGSHLDLITSVQYNRVPVPFAVHGEGAGITVLLDPTTTAKTGKQELMLIGAGGERLLTSVFVVANGARP
jgi:hypothetical protein